MIGIVSCSPHPIARDIVVKPSAESIGRYGLLELTVRLNGDYGNRFFDVAVDVVFSSPGGAQRHVKGFYYGGDVWKVRFRPDEVGTWAFTYTVTGTDGLRARGDGAVDCTPSEAKGPIGQNRENPYRWVFADGRPYFPVGFQDCVYVNGAKLLPTSIDGEGRRDPRRMVSRDEYFALYGRAGFNLLRFSQRNCSYVLYDDLDSYREAEGRATDELLSLARRHGFRVMFGFFGKHGNWTHAGRIRGGAERVRRTFGTREEALDDPAKTDIVAKEKRFIEYAVARWGVYVDIWQLLNERKASDEWTTVMARHVRSVDPDRKPISTSWEKPDLPVIDVNTPHWYESENEHESDLKVTQNASRWKRPGKPVIVGEQGNRGMNWDPGSALRMRIRTWTALFQEIGLVFWNQSGSKAGMHYGRYTPGAASNIYLGPVERSYIRVLQDFSARLDARVRTASVSVSSPSPVRGYGLVSDALGAAYLHHSADHGTTVRGATIALDLPRRVPGTGDLVAEWIDPSTGTVVVRTRVPPGRATLEVPPFTIDLALFVGP